MKWLGTIQWKKLILQFFATFFGSTILVVLLYSFINPPLTPLMLNRKFEYVFKGKKVKIRRDWVSIEKISPHLVQAVIAAEDNRFLEHNGFDFKAMKAAMKYNKNPKHKIKRGASTISQQTAKNVFLWPARSYIRKGFEVYFTFLIEIIWSKKRIMEVYLNVIEMGIGVYGAEAASLYYFNKPVSQITRNEAALIAATLPSPRRYDPKRPSAFLIRQQSRVLVNMRNIGKIDF